MAFLLFAATPTLLYADAAGDLAAGAKQLADGDAKAALPLLQSAAEALPDSVEAQLALADCRLQLGAFEDALAGYRRVLKLSPDHRRAKDLVAALTSRASSREDRLALIKRLLSLNEYSGAINVINDLNRSSQSEAEKQETLFIQAETLLLVGDASSALSTALKVVNSASDPLQKAESQIIAALSIHAQDNAAAIESFLANPPANLPALWQGRAALAKARTLAVTGDDPVAASKLLREHRSALPATVFRRWSESSLSRLLSAANEAIHRGDRDQALAILWPMFSNGDPAAAEMPAITTGQGWVTGVSPKAEETDRVVTYLTNLGDFAPTVSDERFTTRKLAAEILLQLVENADLKVTDKLVELASKTGGLSEASAAGEPLSPGDAIQMHILNRLAAHPNENVRRQVVAQVTPLVSQYYQADNLATLLQHMAAVPAEAEPTAVALQGGFAKMPYGGAKGQLVHMLAEAFAGLTEQQRSPEVLRPDPKAPLARTDVIAITLESQYALARSDSPELSELMNDLVQRYVSREQWVAAEQAIAMYYGEADVHAATLAKVSIALRQLNWRQNQQINAQLSLPQELDPAALKALSDLAAALGQPGGKKIRDRAIALVDPLISQYASLERFDLARTVIATVRGKEEQSVVADWALWSEATLLGQTASTELAHQAARFEGVEKIAVHPAHVKQFTLLGELLTKHPKSPYASQAAALLPQIAQTYEHYQAFDAAHTLLAGFVEKHPLLQVSSSLEYTALLILFRKADDAFAKAAPHDKPPAELSPEYAAALNAAAAYLTLHPTGAYAVPIENKILELVRTYGAVGAWSAARSAIAAFEKAAPTFRRPEHLRLLTAVTYLGELDRQHALEFFGQGLMGQSVAPISGVYSSLATIAPMNGPSPVDPVAQSQPTADAPSIRYTQPNQSSTPQGQAGGGIAGLGGYNPAPNGGVLPGAFTPGEEGASQPGLDALAMIRQSQQRQSANIAMMFESETRNDNGANQEDGQQQALQQQQVEYIATSAGPVLSDTELKRQDAASEQAYKLLLALIKEEDSAASASARAEMLWLFGFFSGQQRQNKSADLIDRYLADQPDDSAVTALALQSLNERLAWAGRRGANDRIDLDFLDQRHELFEAARTKIADFVERFDEEKTWRRQGQMLLVNTYRQEANLAANVSAVRASGFLVQAARSLLDVLQNDPNHTQAGSFPNQLWALAERLHGLGQRDRAIYVYSQIPIYFPMADLANPAVLQIASLHAENLSNPLKAVETYQEYLSMAGNDQNVPTQIFSIAQQLTSGQRYLEALHVFGVFVDSFPTDPRACLALQSIGQTHQANEAWSEAMKAYQRVLDEYPACDTLPDVKLAIAECHINLSEWGKARKLYDEFAQQYAQHAKAAIAIGRAPVLKQLDRYQTLIADKDVDRNKDDAQFQIGRIVLTQLGNHIKAIEEFRKVVADHNKSDLADDAQLEIGKALLALERGEEAREELGRVAKNYPGSPFADDALYLIGVSYQQQAQRLAVVTSATAWARVYERNQQQAYRAFNDVVQQQTEIQSARRAQLKGAGKKEALGLDEAANSFRYNGLNFDNISNSAKLAEQQAETESALQVANRQDRISEAYRQAVARLMQVAEDYPLGDKTDDALLEVAQIYETKLKDRAAAMKTYQRVVQLFPGTPVAEDAAWRVAAFYEQEGRFTAAAAAYREFIRTYPASNRVADAQFALAETLEQLGKWVEAMDAYEVFRQKFGQHPKAQLASEQIIWIKAYRK